MRWTPRLLSLLLTLPLFTWAQDGTWFDHDPSVEEMAGRRDLKLYDNGGDIHEMRMDGQQLFALRAFIWDHWNQKKRGFVRFTDSYIDSGNEAFIFIEPRASGPSHIVIRSLHYWVGGDVVRRDLRDLPEVVALERATPQKDDYGGDYVLLFRDKDGKIVKRL